LGATKHEIDDGAAEVLRTVDFSLRPGQRALLHQLFPARERVAWGEPLILDLFGFTRIAGPQHRAFHFRTKPEDITAMELRDGNGQYTAGHADDVGELGPLQSQAVSDEGVGGLLP